MTFAWPQLLWLLALPAALLAWELTRRRRAGDPAAHPKIHRAETGLNSVTLAAPKQGGEGGTLGARRRLWLCAGLALSVVALARPQWGHIDEPVFEQSREILIAMDLSRSMLTPDVAPSRLDRAKLLVQSLLDRLAGERVGLAVFSGTAFLQAPLSADYEILREFLPALGPDFLPVGGTNYGALIDAAAGAFGDGPGTDRFLIILSDGGATDDDWRSHIGKLTDKGIRVIGLGIGTAAGGFIPDGEGGFMKDERGAVVKAALESDTLRELADKTGGAYRDASQWVDLPALLKSTVEAARKGQFVEKNTVFQIERFQWALAPAVLCLLMSFWREFPVRPRPRSMKLEAGSGGRDRPFAPTVQPVALERTVGRGRPTLPSLVLILALALRATAADAPPPPPGVQLGRIVGRLAAQDSPGALDWAELGNETVTWGQQSQSAHEAVPPGPVRDALAAVDAGSALDAKAADWPKLRADLEALLKKPEDQKQDKSQQNQQKKNQQQQQQQQNQKQNGQQQNQPQPNEQQQNEQQPQNEQQQQQQNQRDQQQQGATQQVGGQGEPKQKDPADADPSLAVPLEKLGEVRDQDSPGALFEMIENNEPRPPPNTNGKNW